MSTALNQAIYKRLAGIEDLSAYPAGQAAQTAVVALLATITLKPGVTKKAVHFGNKNTFRSASGAIAYPAITFRPSGGSPDGRFGAEGGAICSPIYDLEIWESDGRADTITNIAEQVEILLDRRRQVTPVPALSAGKLVWMEALTELLIQHDQAINAWFGLIRYRCVEARY